MGYEPAAALSITPSAALTYWLDRAPQARAPQTQEKITIKMCWIMWGIILKKSLTLTCC